MPPSPQSTPAPASVLAPAMSPAVSRPPADADAEQSPLPKLRLEIGDLNHPGARVFLSAVDPTECMATGIAALRHLLYAASPGPASTPPPTRSVTLILSDMSGVAHTTGSDLDQDHKEIHISLDYLARIRGDRATAEIAGVVTHELVHCYQYDGFETCPGGLVEGVADWVRLRSDLVPPHWERDATGCWDAGYDTTAYFLDYLEGRFCGIVPRINDKLRAHQYDECLFWQELTQTSVHQLWKDYGDSLGCKKVLPDGEVQTDED